MIRFLIGIAAGAAAFLAAAPALADALAGQAEQQRTNWPAILMFGGFVLLTLGITRWAAKRKLINLVAGVNIVRQERHSL